METKNINHGYIPESVEHSYGGAESRPVLNDERMWIPFLPVFEPQIFKYVSTSACVTFMVLNIYEIFLRYKYGLELNFADRATATWSGTVWPKGNTFSRVITSTIEDGLVFEEDWPTDFEMFSHEEYYKIPPAEVRAKAEENKNRFIVSPPLWIHTDPDSLYTALGRSPLGVAWYSGKPDADGVHPRYDRQANHGVTLCGAIYGKCWFIFDSLPGQKTIKKLAWNSRFDAAVMPNIDLDTMSKFVIAKEEGDGKKGYAILGEAREEGEFRNVCEFLGVPLPMKDGTIDWENVKHSAVYRKE